MIQDNNLVVRAESTGKTQINSRFNDQFQRETKITTNIHNRKNDNNYRKTTLCTDGAESGRDVGAVDPPLAGLCRPGRGGGSQRGW